MNGKPTRPTWTRGAEFVRLVIGVLWFIGTYAVVASANRSGSVAQGAIGVLILTVVAAGGLWIVARVSSS